MVRSTDMDYYLWLIDRISSDYYGRDPKCYMLVLENLFETPFYSLIPRDDNRLGDAKDLFNRYESKLDVPFDGGILIPHLENGYSVLEIMISLAERMENEYLYDFREGDRTALWFWSMMDNLGLTDYYDDNYDQEAVDGIIYDLLERRYDEDGSGGLFRTRNINIDMRNLEIWYQMNLYINELFS